MDSNFSSRPQKLDSEAVDKQQESFLVLHNDEVNTFEFVMDTLVEVCSHTMNQAEQCALITHYKGKCEVRAGTINELKKIRKELVSRGLKATIE